MGRSRSRRLNVKVVTGASKSTRPSPKASPKARCERVLGQLPQAQRELRRGHRVIVAEHPIR
jgi:hypothetical protein